MRSDLKVHHNPALAGALRPVLPQLSDEIIAAIGVEVDEYRRPFEGAFGRNVRLGVERALSRFVDLIADPAAEDEPARRTYIELGRGEFRQGRALDALLAAYRLGARLAWRRFAATGAAAGVAPEELYRLGEAIFAYIDELSAESVEGYAAEQSLVAGERQQRRRRLVALLAQDPPADPASMLAAADAAGWAPPASVAALVADVAAPDAFAARLGPDVLAASLDDLVVALVPDAGAPGARARLEAAVGRRTAALGPLTPWEDAARSVERARLAHRLARRGVLRGDGLLVADEHLPELALHGDPSLAADLAARELAPFADLGVNARARLEQTLRVWLDLRGRVEEVGRALAVHPQTVRYRLAQLRELFGARLDDPEGRLALSLALRANCDEKIVRSRT